MIGPVEAIDFFFEASCQLQQRYGPTTKVDVQPIADEKGVDLKECMELVRDIMKSNKYHVGGHYFCTERNVLPMYDKKNILKENKDHVEGLYRIIQVHIGQMKDY